MSERRWDPTTGEWRTFVMHPSPPADDDCPLCPTVPGGPPTEVSRPDYQIAVLDDRFPPLSAQPPEPTVAGSALSPVEPAYGATEVVLYSDRHDVTLADVGVDHVARLVDVWAHRYAVLGARDEVAYVFVVEDEGEPVAGTPAHPHGRIYGYPDIPPRARQQLDAAQRHLEQRGSCVWCDVVAQERADALRVVAANAHWLAFVPFAARFPYEVQLVTLRHAPSLLDLSDPERYALAELLHRVVRGYGALFGSPLPYVMSMHQAPTDDGPWLPVSHLHLELTPLHRTADRLKHLAGSELGAGAFLNDTLPERAAAALREAVPGA